MINFNNKIKSLSDYPFERLRSLFSFIKKKHRRKLLDLSIGQPHHSYPSFVKRIIQRESNKWHLYPPLAGLEDLRKAYKNWLVRRFNLKTNSLTEDVLPLSGTREGLFLVALTLDINNIVVPNPFYQAYIGASLFQKSKVNYLTSSSLKTGFFNLKELEKNLQNKKSIVYFCSPSNPEGRIAPSSYIKKLIKIVRENNAVLIIDECYIDIYYKTRPEGSIKVCEEVGKDLKNILIFHSLSKRSNIAGMRSGFIVGDEGIISLFKRLRSYCAPAIPIPIQLVSAKLWEDDKHVKNNRLEYAKKVNYADKVLSKYKMYKKPDAGFYLWIYVKDGEKFAKELFAKYNIKVMPGKYLAKGFRNNPGKEYVRVALVQTFAQTKYAIDKIAELLECQ